MPYTKDMAVNQNNFWIVMSERRLTIADLSILSKCLIRGKMCEVTNCFPQKNKINIMAAAEINIRRSLRTGLSFI